MHWFKVFFPLLGGWLQIRNVENEANLLSAIPTGFILYQGHYEEHPCFLWKEVGPEMSLDLRGERIWDRNAILKHRRLRLSVFWL